jgi:F0F1-type ATP synthase assembly protein I
MENKEGFSFTYSAAQQQEVKNIRRKYLPEEDKMEELRKLHNSATQKAQAWSIALGVIGALILGAGMSLFMTDLGAALGHLAMVIGVCMGIAGMILMALAYPVYNRVLKKERQRIAPEILRLTDELMQ